MQILTAYGDVVYPHSANEESQYPFSPTKYRRINRGAEPCQQLPLGPLTLPKPLSRLELGALGCNGSEPKTWPQNPVIFCQQIDNWGME
jgi:hypothetical protein